MHICLNYLMICCCNISFVKFCEYIDLINILCYFLCNYNENFVNLCDRWHWPSTCPQIWSHYSLGAQNRWYFDFTRICSAHVSNVVYQKTALTFIPASPANNISWTSQVTCSGRDWAIHIMLLRNWTAVLNIEALKNLSNEWPSLFDTLTLSWFMIAYPVKPVIKRWSPTIYWMLLTCYIHI